MKLLKSPSTYEGIIITNHAVDRSIQRGRLFFNKLGLTSKDEIKNYLKFDIRRAMPQIDVKWINCPFYQNSLGLLGDSPRVKFISNIFEYRCEIVSNKLKCMTVIFRSK